MAPTPTGKGYWVSTSDGALWPFGDAADHGSPKGLGLVLASGPVDLVAAVP